MFKKISILFTLVLCVSCNVESPSQAENTPNVISPPQETAGLAPEHAQLEKTLIHNAKIYTMDIGFSTADAILFDSSGRIHNVGGEQAMLEAFPDAMHIDLRGKTIIPGLIDSHAHLYGLAMSLSQAQLRDTGSVEEVIQRLREQEQHLADGDWLLGRGWDQNDWPVKEFPAERILTQNFQTGLSGCVVLTVMPVGPTAPRSPWRTRICPVTGSHRVVLFIGMQMVRPVASWLTGPWSWSQKPYLKSHLN